MLSANELRIGNCVKDHTGAVRFISHRKLSDIASNPDNHGYEPIPLTPEILEACGFHSPEKGYLIFSNGSFLIREYDDGKYKLSGYTDYSVKIDYLHQLQNLFYYLSGSELTVNLKEKV